MLSGLQSSWDAAIASPACIGERLMWAAQWVSGRSSDWHYKCPLLSVGLEDPADDGQSNQ